MSLTRAKSKNLTYKSDATGASIRTIHDKLGDVVSVKDFGAKGDGVADDTDAIQAALDTGDSVYFPAGTYVVSSTLSTTTTGSRGQQLIGAGRDNTIISGNHTTGAVIRLKGVYQGISDLSIRSIDARSSATNTSGYGLHIEPDDNPSDAATLTGYLYNMEISNIVISGQPSTGLYVAGGVTNGSTFDRLRIFSNRGHGFHSEDGTQHRTNPAGVGLFNINHCNIFGNSGNGIALGNPADTGTATTQTVRIQINNCDVGDNALSAGVRFGAYQVWVAGSNHEIRTCYTSDSQATPTTGGVYIQGTNNIIENLRTNDVDPAVQVGDNGAALRTAGISITGLTCLTTDIADLDPAVLVDGNASDVHVETIYESQITSLVSPTVTGLSIGSDQVLFKKISDQTVNNTTTKVGISQLAYSMNPDEEIRFELILAYVAGGTGGNISIGFNYPTTAQVRWCTVDGRRTLTSGTVSDQYVQSSTTNTLPIIADTNQRLVHIVGFVRNTDTAEGTFQPTFAQATAQAHDLTIKSVMSYMKVEKIKPLAY